MNNQYRKHALALTAALALMSGSVLAQPAAPAPNSVQSSTVQTPEVQKSEEATEASHRLITVSDQALNSKKPTEQSRPRGESRSVETKSSPDKPLLEIKGF